ncbi:MAG: magnesium protoporphyrin IX methyltransferase [Pseudomonadota bacterium]
MTQTTYENRRRELQTYFDRTAKDNWVALTSNTPVSRIRETVRAGREAMRQTLMSFLPDDLSGARILDAGCGTGMLAMEAASRGAEVVAVDISPALVEEARKRSLNLPYSGSVTFKSGDMTEPKLGTFDYIVAMDSLIHYPLTSVIPILGGLAPRAKQKIVFTFAPRTPALAVMKTVGKFFPKNDRSPAIEPISETKLAKAINCSSAGLAEFRICTTRRVSTGFYKSQAMELRRT